MNRNDTVRTLLSLFVGGFVGALGGALAIALPTYFSDGDGFFGPASGWAGPMALIGFVSGIVPGVIIGLLAALLKTDIVAGAALGTFVGIIILIIFFALGVDPYVDTLHYAAGVLCIPAGTVTGLMVSLINRRHNRDRLEDKSLNDPKL